MVRPLLLFVLLWTLALIFLGSYVHATDASLACPDWPTCFGTMMPEMTGGVFWEHLHRLWAGALLMLFAVSVALVRRGHPDRPGLFRLGLAGIAMLLAQSVLGGMTVLLRLPDAISAAHLAMALAFVALLTTLLVRTGRGGGTVVPRGEEERRLAAGEQASHGVRAALRRSSDNLALRMGLLASALVYAQSMVGAWVRHRDAGMACPDVPLCLGRLVPPLEFAIVRLHYLHRVFGVVAAVVVVACAWVLVRRGGSRPARIAGAALGAGVVAQVLLGFASVAARLDPVLVSLHSVIAATLLAIGVGVAARSWGRAPV